MHPLVWISTEVNRGRWGFVRLHRDIGKQQKHLRSEPSRCYLQVFCICTSRFKGNVCHPNADRIPRHRSCRCNRMHARSLVLCTKSHGKGCRHDCLVDGKSIVHETTDTRVLGRLRSWLRQAHNVAKILQVSAHAFDRRALLADGRLCGSVYVFQTWQMMHRRGKIQHLSSGTSSLNLSACSGRGTDTRTPFFVWKQYSFQWETFSQVRQGNPTLN